MKKRFNVIAAAVLALGMVVGMCGCEGQLPQPKTTQRQDAPNLTAKQEKTIRMNILKTLDQCNNDRNIDALGSILEGPELEIRTSELHVAQVTGNLDRKTTIPTDLAQAVISTDSGWPRSVFSITSTTDDQQSKRLVLNGTGAAGSIRKPSAQFWRGRNLRFAQANFMWRRSRAILTARPRFQLI